MASVRIWYWSFEWMEQIYGDDSFSMELRIMRGIRMHRCRWCALCVTDFRNLMKSVMSYNTDPRLHVRNVAIKARLWICIFNVVILHQLVCVSPFSGHHVWCGVLCLAVSSLLVFSNSRESGLYYGRLIIICVVVRVWEICHCAYWYEYVDSEFEDFEEGAAHILCWLWMVESEWTGGGGMGVELRRGLGWMKQGEGKGELGLLLTTPRITNHKWDMPYDLTCRFFSIQYSKCI